MNYPKLPDKVYDVIKWACLIVVPAVIALITGLSNTWSWSPEMTVGVTQTISLIAVFVGAVLGFSSAAYAKKDDSEN